MGKHVSATADTHATIKDIAENGVSCKVRVEAV
jgi:hypothetical protein